MNPRSINSNLARSTRGLLQGLAALTLFAAMPAPAGTLLSQNFDGDPVNYAVTGAQAAGTSYFALSNAASITLNPNLSGASGVYFAGQAESTNPCQLTFDPVSTLGFTDLNLSISLAGAAAVENDNFIRALLDTDGNGTYETTLFNFTGASNSPYNDKGPLALGDLSAAFKTLDTIPLPAGDGTLRLRIETWSNSTTNENVGIDSILITNLPPQAKLTSFGPGATIGALSGNAAAITWYVAGTSAVALSPTFTLSNGATCTVAGIPAVSGETRDFTNPVDYTVKSSDLAITNVYTVTVILVPVEATVIWNLAGGGAWDTNLPNWLGQVSNLPTLFTNGANVIFDKTTGGTIALAAGMEPLTTTVSATSGTYTFSAGPLAGTGSLTKSGNGNLTITTVTNTYSGGTIINAGQLRMDVLANAALGTGPVTLNGGVLFLERITAANDLIVNGGTLLPSNGWGDSWNGSVTLNSNLIVAGDGNSGTTNFNGTISGVGGLTFNGPNAMQPVLAVANSYTGPTSVTACTLKCNHVDALGSGALNISSTANSKVNLNYSGEHNVASLTLGGVVQASGTYGSTASGATNQNDTFFVGTGMVRVPASSVKNMLVFSFGALGAATINDTNNTITLEVPFGTDRTALAPTYTVSLGATGSPVSGTTLNFTSGQIYTVTAEDLTTRNYTVTVTEAVLPDIFTWASAASGDWSIPANWTNEADPVVVTAPLASGRESYTLNFNAAGTYTATNNLNAGFELNQLNLGAAVTLAGNGLAFVANGATLPTMNQNSGSTVTISNELVLGSDMTYGGSGSGWMRLSGALSGAGSFTKNGTGTLEITGLKHNTYSGGTVINSGTLFVNDVQTFSGLGTGSVTLSGGVLHLNRAAVANNVMVNSGSLILDNGFGSSMSGTITNNAPTLNITAWYVSHLISGAISGSGGITVNSSYGGGVILSGTNIYTGPTTVTGGTLQCNSPDAVASGDWSISGGMVNLNFSGTKNVASLTLGGLAQTAPGTYGSVASGATFPNDTYFAGSGTVTLGGAAGYGTWAATNAPGQTPDQDFDNDGVENGIEYFMGQTGSSFTAMPVLDGTNTVTWIKDPAYSGTWQVQTSPDLVAWTDVAGTDNTTSVSYTLLTGAGKLFVRLLVTPTP